MSCTLLDLPPELLHLIAFELWALSAKDIASFRSVCSHIWTAFPASGLDLAKWEARMGPTWCMKYNRPRALTKCYVAGSPHGPAANGNEAIRWASRNGHLEVV